MNIQQVRRLRDDPALFSYRICKQKPLPPQLAFLRTKDKYCIIRTGRQFGKTDTVAIGAGHFAMFADFRAKLRKSETECDIICTAQKKEIAQMMANRIVKHLRKDPWSAKHIKTDIGRVKEIRWATGRGMTSVWPVALGDTGAGSRGPTASLIIEDERAYQPDAAIAALEGTGAASNPHIWCMGTPDGAETDYYDMCKNARLGSDPIDDVYSKDKNAEWIQFCAKSEDAPYVSKKFLAMQKRKLPHEIYMQEYEGQFIGLGNYVYHRKALNWAVDHVVRVDNPVVDIGMDIARKGSNQTVYIVLEHNREWGRIIHMESEDISSTPFMAAKAAGLYKRFGARRINLETNGIGGGVADDLATYHDIATPDDAYSPKTKSALHSNLVRILDSHLLDATICGDYRHVLMLQMRGMKKEYKSNVMYVSGEPDDWPDALALACKHMRMGGTGPQAFSAPGLDPNYRPPPRPEPELGQPQAQSMDYRIESVMDRQDFWDNL